MYELQYVDNKIQTTYHFMLDFEHNLQFSQQNTENIKSQTCQQICMNAFISVM